MRVRVLLLLCAADAFLAPCRPGGRRLGGRLSAKINRESFLREPEFDPLSLRSFRRETLIQYSNTNWSEPLRISLALFVALLGAGAGPLAASVGPPLGLLQQAGALALGAAGALVFARERGARTKQLERVEREYAVGDLQLERCARARRPRVESERERRRPNAERPGTTLSLPAIGVDAGTSPRRARARKSPCARCAASTAWSRSSRRRRPRCGSRSPRRPCSVRVSSR